MALESELVEDARHLLASWLERPRFRVARGAKDGPDFEVDLGKTRLLVEVKATPNAANIGAAVQQVKAYAAATGRRSVPVVVTSFMGESGKRLCADAGVSWFDLSGNAHILAPGLRIIIEGKPNKFLRRGRPSSAFAPKSARIARHLLIEPRRWYRQQELSREVGLDDGFTSKIVRRLERDTLIERNKAGAVRVRDPDLMLDAWAEVYAFEKHSILRGHITARSSDELLRRLAKTLQSSKLRHAATGLAAAWLQTEFAGFRLVTFFIASQPDAALLREVGFREEPKGANVWLVVPDDEGVFDGGKELGGIACVQLRDIEEDFAAIIAPGLRLAFLDRVKVTLDGRTIRNEQARREVAVCGAGAFVVMKALAFRIRGENKDAYDLVYILRNFGEGPPAVAARLEPLAKEVEAREARRCLAEDFETVGHIGPVRAAEFTHGGPNDEAQADAWGAVRDLLDRLPE